MYPVEASVLERFREHDVLGNSVPHDGGSWTEVDNHLIMLALSDIAGHRDTC
jgi:hypothetical protein